MTVISLMAAALAQELRDRDIAALGAPICESIIEAVIKRTGDIAARLVNNRDEKPTA